MSTLLDEIRNDYHALWLKYFEKKEENASSSPEHLLRLAESLREVIELTTISRISESWPVVVRIRFWIIVCLMYKLQEGNQWSNLFHSLEEETSFLFQTLKLEAKHLFTVICALNKHLLLLPLSKQQKGPSLKDGEAAKATDGEDEENTKPEKETEKVPSPYLIKYNLDIYIDASILAASLGNMEILEILLKEKEKAKDVNFNRHKSFPKIMTTLLEYYESKQIATTTTEGTVTAEPKAAGSNKSGGPITIENFQSLIAQLLSKRCFLVIEYLFNQQSSTSFLQRDIKQRMIEALLDQILLKDYEPGKIDFLIRLDRSIENKLKMKWFQSIPNLIHKFHQANHVITAKDGKYLNYSIKRLLQENNSGGGGGGGSKAKKTVSTTINDLIDNTNDLLYLFSFIQFIPILLECPENENMKSLFFSNLLNDFILLNQTTNVNLIQMKTIDQIIYYWKVFPLLQFQDYLTSNPRQNEELFQRFLSKLTSEDVTKIFKEFTPPSSSKLIPTTAVNSSYAMFVLSFHDFALFHIACERKNPIMIAQIINYLVDQESQAHRVPTYELTRFVLYKNYQKGNQQFFRLFYEGDFENVIHPMFQALSPEARNFLLERNVDDIFPNDCQIEEKSFLHRLKLSSDHSALRLLQFVGVCHRIQDQLPYNHLLVWLNLSNCDFTQEEALKGYYNKFFEISVPAEWRILDKRFVQRQQNQAKRGKEASSIADEEEDLALKPEIKASVELERKGKPATLEDWIKICRILKATDDEIAKTFLPLALQAENISLLKELVHLLPSIELQQYLLRLEFITKQTFSKAGTIYPFLFRYLFPMKQINSFRTAVLENRTSSSYANHIRMFHNLFIKFYHQKTVIQDCFNVWNLHPDYLKFFIKEGLHLTTNGKSVIQLLTRLFSPEELIILFRYDSHFLHDLFHDRDYELFQLSSWLPEKFYQYSQVFLTKEEYDALIQRENFQRLRAVLIDPLPGTHSHYHSSSLPFSQRNHQKFIWLKTIIKPFVLFYCNNLSNQGGLIEERERRLTLLFNVLMTFEPLFLSFYHDSPGKQRVMKELFSSALVDSTSAASFAVSSASSEASSLLIVALLLQFNNYHFSYRILDLLKSNHPLQYYQEEIQFLLSFFRTQLNRFEFIIAFDGLFFTKLFKHTKFSPVQVLNWISFGRKDVAKTTLLYQDGIPFHHLLSKVYTTPSTKTPLTTTEKVQQILLSTKTFLDIARPTSQELITGCNYQYLDHIAALDDDLLLLDLFLDRSGIIRNVPEGVNLLQHIRHLPTIGEKLALLFIRSICRAFKPEKMFDFYNEVHEQWFDLLDTQYTWQRLLQDEFPSLLDHDGSMIRLLQYFIHSNRLSDVMFLLHHNQACIFTSLRYASKLDGLNVLSFFHQEFDQIQNEYNNPVSVYPNAPIEISNLDRKNFNFLFQLLRYQVTTIQKTNRDRKNVNFLLHLRSQEVTTIQKTSNLELDANLLDRLWPLILDHPPLKELFLQEVRRNNRELSIALIRYGSDFIREERIWNILINEWEDLFRAIFEGIISIVPPSRMEGYIAWKVNSIRLLSDQLTTTEAREAAVNDTDCQRMYDIIVYLLLRASSQATDNFLLFYRFPRFQRFTRDYSSLHHWHGRTLPELAWMRENIVINTTIRNSQSRRDRQEARNAQGNGEFMTPTLTNLAGNTESSMVRLTANEELLLEGLYNHYEIAANQVDHWQYLQSNLLTYLAKEYKKNPIKVPTTISSSGDPQVVGDVEEVITLPLDFNDFLQISTDFSNELKQRCFEGYYQHKVHTAYRFLSMNNHFLHPDASFIVREPDGQRHSNFTAYSRMINVMFLAAKDPNAVPIRDFTIETRINFFIDCLAGLNRAHNWDNTRINHITGAQEEYDDLEGDNPSCNPGIKRRLFMSLPGHSMMVMITKDLILGEIDSFIYQHYKKILEPLSKQALEDLKEVFSDYIAEGCFGDDNVIPTALNVFDLSNEIVDEFIQNLKKQLPNGEGRIDRYQEMIRSEMSLKPPMRSYLDKYGGLIDRLFR